MTACRRRAFLLVAMAAGVGIFWGTSLAFAQGRSEEARQRELARVVDVHARHADRLLELPDVVGVAVGVDWLEKPVLKVLTRKGWPAALPKKLDGVEVEVIETGEIFAIPPRMEPEPLRVQPLAVKPAADKPPTVKFTYPKDGETFVGTIQLKVDARDDKKVVRVDFYYQDYDAFCSSPQQNPPILLGSDTNGADGWSYQWHTAEKAENGEPVYPDAHYIVWAEAVDSAGQKASHNIALFVDNTLGEPPEYSPDRPAYSPISPIGVSVGNQNQLSAGTLGCVVADVDGVRYILSNNHVLALENTAPIGSWIFQPGLYDTDGGIPYAWMRVGLLTRYVSITFSRRANNQVDAAIAQIESHPYGEGGLLVDTSTPYDGYGQPRSNHLTNSELSKLFGAGSFPVQKYGRTTRLTYGQVTAINATVLVSYRRGVARFVNQIMVQGPAGFILPGDSGSLLVLHSSSVDMDRRPVGLLFAGNSDGTVAFANRIEDVLNALSVERIVEKYGEE